MTAWRLNAEIVKVPPLFLDITQCSLIKKSFLNRQIEGIFTYGMQLNRKPRCSVDHGYQPCHFCSSSTSPSLKGRGPSAQPRHPRRRRRPHRSGPSQPFATLMYQSARKTAGPGHSSTLRPRATPITRQSGAAGEGSSCRTCTGSSRAGTRLR